MRTADLKLLKYLDRIVLSIATRVPGLVVNIEIITHLTKKQKSLMNEHQDRHTIPLYNCLFIYLCCLVPKSWKSFLIFGRLKNNHVLNDIVMWSSSLTLDTNCHENWENGHMRVGVLLQAKFETCVTHDLLLFSNIWPLNFSFFCNWLCVFVDILNLQQSVCSNFFRLIKGFEL